MLQDFAYAKEPQLIFGRGGKFELSKLIFWLSEHQYQQMRNLLCSSELSTNTLELISSLLNSCQTDETFHLTFWNKCGYLLWSHIFCLAVLDEVWSWSKKLCFSLLCEMLDVFDHSNKHFTKHSLLFSSICLCACFAASRWLHRHLSSTGFKPNVWWNV